MKSLESSLLAFILITGCESLQIPPYVHHSNYPRPTHAFERPTWHNTPRFGWQSRRKDTWIAAVDSDEIDDDDLLLESVDIETLQNLCQQYNVEYEITATKADLLQNLRTYADKQAELDQKRRQTRAMRVEAGLEGKARHTILEASLFGESDDSEEDVGYFYYSAPESEKEKKQREEESRKKKMEQLRKARESSARVTAPPLPPDVKRNEKGERVVTVYSTTDKNDLTGATSQAQFAQNDINLNDIYQKPKSEEPEDSLIAGPFGDTSGFKRKKADTGQIEQAKEELTELVRNLLATTGAPAFQDDFMDEQDGDGDSSTNLFSSPYGFTGFDSQRIPPALISRSSAALRIQNGEVLREVLSEYELQAIGHDGMAADDKSEGGGHYREVEKVGSFLNAFRKAEERRIARETTTMLLDRLVKGGVVGLDKMLSGMIREGEYTHGSQAGEGELNTALVRYLEEAIREQERRVQLKHVPNTRKNIELQASLEDDELNLMWNVTRGEDGTVIETIDPNNPQIGKMLQDELNKQKSNMRQQDEDLAHMTVQEKMLLLLKLLRDRVKVEAVIGNDQHARNLRVLAYCLKAKTGSDRQQLITDELGMSLDVRTFHDCLKLFLMYPFMPTNKPFLHLHFIFFHDIVQSLDTFSDLVTSSIDYAEARANDNDYLPAKQITSSLLNISELKKIKTIVERIKANQSWKASGVSPFE